MPQRTRFTGVPTALLLLATAATPAAARQAGVAPDGPAARVPDRLSIEAPELPVNGAVAFLASAALPGAGQYLLGNDRWIAYGAVEVWAALSWYHQRRTARSLAERYRDVAWQVARRISTGERRDTVFEYYEAMAHYRTSGAFDLEPNSPGVQPEVERGTYNGDLWALALGLYGATAAPGTPGYERALDYYLDRAIPPGYAWAWGGGLEQQVFVDLIAESDAAFRAASRYIGVILANHIASAVDALVTARLRQLGADVRIESGAAHDRGAIRWEYGLRIGF